ncbi:hypothetical protein NQ317_019635 [Molorchus minor]|uniref:NAD(P)H oxidase (H2O2-forming) n=1 Tax=Molorchus minor TaxID=1323400 RepID=A0ABQ9JDP4_9CUCU|nr:hypothetical protein NQ317_019635 [Molorchus minor]
MILPILPTNCKVKPGGSDWPGNYSQKFRHRIADWLLNGDWSNRTRTNNKLYEYEGYDGFYNNIARPDSGAVDRPLLRRWPAAYEDGSYTPSGSDRPNPFLLSDELLSGDIGTMSKTGRNALFLFFGQQVVEEILDAQRPACPPEYFNIAIPEGHQYAKFHKEMPVLRTRYDMHTGYSPNNPRQQLNEITPYLDGGLVYGTSKQWSDRLRTYKNGTIDPYGRLASTEDGLFPEINSDRLPMANPPAPFYHAHYTNTHETANVNRFFNRSNNSQNSWATPGGNENAFLLTFGILWFRWHNYLAENIHRHNPTWSSEQIYNEARKWVIATQQNIVVYEWLPILLNTNLPQYDKYDASIDPQIDQFFQSAAFRFGHTLVVPGVYLRDYVRNGCRTNFTTWNHLAVRTCNIFWRPQEPILNKTDTGELIDIDRLLMEFPRRDLMAINIQRGRDHGLPDFNSARKAFGLKPYADFGEFRFISDATKKKLEKLYKNIDMVDPWVGGILETGDGPGELFNVTIFDQFKRIRDGDRFWFENEANGLFTKEEISRIKSISIYDIIMAVTKMDDYDIPLKPFRAPVENDTNLIKHCKLERQTIYYHLPQLNSALLQENCSEPATYDYFYNSETSYILTFLGLCTFILGTSVVVYFLIKVKEADNIEQDVHINELIKRKTIKYNWNYPHFVVNEWVGKQYPIRKVIVLFQTDKRQIHLKSANGTILRALDLNTVDSTVTLIWIIDQEILIFQIQHNYDLVLKFDSDYLRNHFVVEFKRNFDAMLKINEMSLNWNSALKIIIMKDDRQKRLEMFFRVVFAQAFTIKHSKNEILKVDASVAKEVVNTELSLMEFADSLNMRHENEFVKRMFSLVDKDKNGFVSFREFMDLLIIFADGTEEVKAKLLFDMYDIDGVGYLNENDFLNMIKSFLETVSGKIEDKDIQTTVDIMIKQAGVEHKDQLTFQDFLKIIGNDIKNLNSAKIDFKGVKNPPSYLRTVKSTIENIYESQEEIETRFKGQISNDTNSGKIIDAGQEEVINVQKSKSRRKIVIILRQIELKSKVIFWMTLYTLILLAIFAERAYYYTVEREHSGLRKIAGYGVTITRGAASAMMFTYSSLLVTMCRNTITYLRDTVLNNYFPFDSYVEIHKYIALWAFVFTIVHVIGHSFNFYHISTQTADDLTCLFRNYFHATHELPKFHYWCWKTITGFTGIVLTVIFIIMYTFTLPIIRRKIYNWFWYAHSLYPLFFIFFILHGTGRLIQELDEDPDLYCNILYNDSHIHTPQTTRKILKGVFAVGTGSSEFSLAHTKATSHLLLFFGTYNFIHFGLFNKHQSKKIEIPVIKAEILPSNVTKLVFRKPENFQYKAGQWVRIACLALNKREYHPFTLSSAPDEDNLTVHIRAVGPWTTHIRNIYDTMLTANDFLPKIYLDGPYGEGHQDWNTYDVAILIGGGIGVTPFASILKDVSYSAKKTKTHCQKTKRIGVFSCGPPSMTSAVDIACSRVNNLGEQRFEHHFKNF